MKPFHSTEAELVNDEPSSDDDDDLGHCVVMEEAVLKDLLDECRGSCKDAKDEIKKMKNEVAMYSTLHMVGQPKGKVFSGTFGGLFPHIVYQLEGTKAIALVRAAEVSRFKVQSSKVFM